MNMFDLFLGHTVCVGLQRPARGCALGLLPKIKPLGTYGL
jgi:hypothetical protein